MYFHGNGSGYLADVVSANTSVNVYALDFKNAGKSEGDCPGYYESVECLVDQAESFIDFIMQKYEKKTHIFVSGESMGGLVTFKLCIRNP
jgi:alpha-beta hydrolase superfamily lysophospholipase